jgi:hypothetical protein
MHFNLGRKHPNRKVYKKGITQIPRLCLTCSKQFFITCLRPKRKFCSRQCYPKNPNFTTKGKKGSEKQREMMKRKTGENHFGWIKDRTQLKDDHKDRGGQLSKEWSLSVKKRDKWKCRIGNDLCAGRLESHHILSWLNHQELRYDINNGITLCHFHHPRKREDEKKMVDYFKKILNLL